MVLAAIARQDWTGAVDWLHDGELPYSSPIPSRDPGCQPLVARVALAASDRDPAECGWVRAAHVLEPALPATNRLVPYGADAAAWPSENS